MCCRCVSEICQIFFKYVSEAVRSVFNDCHILFRDLSEMFIVFSNMHALFSELFHICFRDIAMTVHIFFIYLLIDFPYVFQILIKEFSNCSIDFPYTCNLFCSYSFKSFSYMFHMCFRYASDNCQGAPPLHGSNLVLL